MNRRSGKDGLIAQKHTVVTNDSSTQVFQAAARGWRIFPVKSRGKEAILRGWPELATTDKAVISKWIRKYPKCNWGLVAGRESGLLIIDVDSDEALKSLEQLGSIPRTFTIKTSRGRHLYFQHPADCAIRNSTSTVADKVDVKAERGYVLTPPSVHPNGTVYQILDDCPPAPLPQWLLKRLDSSPEEPTQPRTEQTNKSVGEGKRNAHLTSLAGAMQRRGISREAIEAALLSENEAQCEPPLPENEVLAIIRSISRYQPATGEAPANALVLGDRPLAQMVPDAEAALKSRAEERIFQTPVSRRLIRIIQHKQNPLPDNSVQRDPEACLLVDVDARYLQLALGRAGLVYA